MTIGQEGGVQQAQQGQLSRKRKKTGGLSGFAKKEGDRTTEESCTHSEPSLFKGRRRGKHSKKKECATLETGGLKQMILFKRDSRKFDLVQDAAVEPDDVLQHLYDLEHGLLNVDRHWFDDSQEIRHSLANDHVQGAIAYSERVLPLTVPIPPCPFDIFKDSIAYKEYHYAVRGDANTLLIVMHGVDLKYPSDPNGEQPNRLAEYIVESPKYAEGDMAGSLRDGYARLREEERIDFSTVLVKENKLFIVTAAPGNFRLFQKVSDCDFLLRPGPCGKLEILEVDRFRGANSTKLGESSEPFTVKVTEMTLVHGNEMLAVVPAYVGRGFDKRWTMLTHDEVKLEDVCEKMLQESDSPKSFVALLWFPKLKLKPGGGLSFTRYEARECDFPTP